MLLNGIHTAIMSRITSGCRKDNVANKNNETALKFILSFSAMINQTADVFFVSNVVILSTSTYIVGHKNGRKLVSNFSIF